MGAFSSLLSLICICSPAALQKKQEPVKDGFIPGKQYWKNNLLLSVMLLKYMREVKAGNPWVLILKLKQKH